MKKLLYLLPLLLLAFSPIADQSSWGATADTRVSNAGPTSNFSSENGFIVGESNASSSLNYAILSFDHTNWDLPDGAVVVSSSFHVTVMTDLSSNSRTVHIYPVTSAVNISTVNWNTRPTNGSSIGSFTVTDSQIDGDDKLASLDLAWINTYLSGGTYDALYLMSDTNLNDAYRYYSDENCTGIDNCPYISITYTVPTSTSTNTAVFTPTITFTPSQTFTPSFTPEISYTPSQTFTPSFTPEFTFTPSITPSITNTPSETPSITFTPSETVTPSLTYTPSITPTPSIYPDFVGDLLRDEFYFQVVFFGAIGFLLFQEWIYALIWAVGWTFVYVNGTPPLVFIVPFIGIFTLHKSIAVLNIFSTKGDNKNV